LRLKKKSAFTPEALIEIGIHHQNAKECNKKCNKMQHSATECSTVQQNAKCKIMHHGAI
jgi:hypothetical protein